MTNTRKILENIFVYMILLLDFIGIGSISNLGLVNYMFVSANKWKSKLLTETVNIVE